VKWKTGLATLELGVFHSVNNQSGQGGHFYRNVTADGQGNFIAFRGDAADAASTSIELRATRTFREGPRAHRFILNTRARDRDQTFGGTQALDLGVVNVLTPPALPEPTFTPGPVTQEAVQQVTGGISYDLKWESVGTLSLGL